MRIGLVGLPSGHDVTFEIAFLDDGFSVHYPSLTVPKVVEVSPTIRTLSFLLPRSSSHNAVSDQSPSGQPYKRDPLSTSQKPVSG